MLNLNKLTPIRGIMWESIHSMMRLERKDNFFIAQEIAYFLDERNDLDDEERAYLAKVACTMIEEQRKECNSDGIKTGAEYMKEKRNANHS